MGGLIVRREGLDYCSNKACQTGLSLYGQRHCLLAIASSLPDPPMVASCRAYARKTHGRSTSFILNFEPGRRREFRITC
ncbi:hypothetical protein V6N11_066569 [Hibiscus sabdariffa]|uniref:Uncharacterized protein n=1 Tax=Hibiscus sabdariffa TaxID=183260 RepID=A0ABR2A3H0_9ROSI